MLRKFTKAIGRYKVGEAHDYPKAVWENMAKSAKAKLDSFSEAIPDNQVLQSSLRGPFKVHPRLGTATR